ncbi:MAG: 16S rRNA processing protein RimM [candidate division WS1 bacterium]|nr:16S rRNA processing protein RimM [candidate division WS1 bacterium]
MANNEQPEAWDVLVGVVAGAHGVHGEVRINPETDFPECFATLEQVCLVPSKAEGRMVRVSGARQHTAKGQVLLRIEGVDRREQAQALRGAELLLRRSDLVPLPKGQYYEFEILGLEVVTEEGRGLGPITGIIRTGANDVYETREALIPAVSQVIRLVDLNGKRMVVRWMEGMEK